MVEQKYKIGEVLEYFWHSTFNETVELCQVIDHILSRNEVGIKFKSGKIGAVRENTASLRRTINHLGIQTEVIEDLW